MLETDRSALKSNRGFLINNITASDAYFIVAERLQMKDRLNPGTFTLSFSGSNSAGVATTLNLTDDSKVNNVTVSLW